jgi:hypothetical protein
MAIFLFKFIRRKVKENQALKESQALKEHQAQQAVPTTDDTHLVPEVVPSQGRNKAHHNDNTEHAYAGIAVAKASPAASIDLQAAILHKEEARQRRIRQWKLMLGLALPNFLAAVDVTIVAPAIPQISSHFGRLIFT